MNHPCKGVCSGWQQGYERGKEEAVKVGASLDHLQSAGERFQESVWAFLDDRKIPAPELRDAMNGLLDMIDDLEDLA